MLSRNWELVTGEIKQFFLSFSTDGIYSLVNCPLVSTYPICYGDAALFFVSLQVDFTYQAYKPSPFYTAEYFSLGCYLFVIVF